MKWISYLPSKQLLGVRIPPGAHGKANLFCPLLLVKSFGNKGFLAKTVDNYVGNVYKGHFLKLSFNAKFIENSLQNKSIILKDTKNNQYVSRETY